jgi:hypothetical protein
VPTTPATVFIFDEIGGSFGVGAKDVRRRPARRSTAPLINVRINSPGRQRVRRDAIQQRCDTTRPGSVPTSTGSPPRPASSRSPRTRSTSRRHRRRDHDARQSDDDPRRVERGPRRQRRRKPQEQHFLDRQSDNIAELYQLRAGGDPAEWRDLMLAETWLFAREAVDLGLADRVELDQAADPTSTVR